MLNVGSIAGFLPGPGMAMYYASKAFVLSFTEALRAELGPQGRARHRAVPGPGADRIPAAGRFPAGIRFGRPERLLRRRRAAGL